MDPSKPHRTSINGGGSTSTTTKSPKAKLILLKPTASPPRNSNKKSTHISNKLNESIKTLSRGFSQRITLSRKTKLDQNSASDTKSENQTIEEGQQNNGSVLEVISLSDGTVVRENTAVHKYAQNPFYNKLEKNENEEYFDKFTSDKFAEIWSKIDNLQHLHQLALSGVIDKKVLFLARKSVSTRHLLEKFPVVAAIDKVENPHVAEAASFSTRLVRNVSTRMSTLKRKNKREVENGNEPVANVENFKSFQSTSSRNSTRSLNFNKTLKRAKSTLTNVGSVVNTSSSTLKRIKATDFINEQTNNFSSMTFMSKFAKASENFKADYLKEKWTALNNYYLCQNFSFETSSQTAVNMKDLNDMKSVMMYGPSSTVTTANFTFLELLKRKVKAGKRKKAKKPGFSGKHEKHKGHNGKRNRNGKQEKGLKVTEDKGSFGVALDHNKVQDGKIPATLLNLSLNDFLAADEGWSDSDDEPFPVANSGKPGTLPVENQNAPADDGSELSV